MKSIALISRFLVCSLAATLVVSCASGPKFADSKLPPIPAGKGRVFVYRTATMGAMIKPSIKFDNQVIGTAAARGYTYTDATPGTHNIELRTEVTRSTSVAVAAGKASYVKLNVSMGFAAARITPENVDAATGAADIQNCGLAK
jgi:hypothetical protein